MSLNQSGVPAFAVLLLAAAGGSHAGLAPAQASHPVSRPASAPAVKEKCIVVTEEALRIHRSGLLIDGHNDLLWQLRVKGGSSFEKLDIGRHQKALQTDIPRLRQGGVGAQFWAIYTPPETEHTGEAMKMALEEFDLYDRMMARYPETFEAARTAADVERIHKAGRIACLIGIEGGHIIENSIGNLAVLHGRGARYLGLTHTATTDWADSGTDAPRHGGLAPFGEQVIRELNRLGMLVDLAHVSAECMREAIAVSRAPVIVSHAAAFAVAPHQRNVPDDVLRMIARRGGVVMVTFFPGYTDPDGARAMGDWFEQERAIKARHLDPAETKRVWQKWKDAHPIPAGSVGIVVDHIDHIIRVAGIDCVGLGSDYDGVAMMPPQLEDVSGYPVITQELLKRGYSESDIHKIMGGNILRVLRRAEEIAGELQRPPA